MCGETQHHQRENPDCVSRPEGLDVEVSKDVHDANQNAKQSQPEPQSCESPRAGCAERRTPQVE
jgi:hypothetical protein